MSKIRNNMTTKPKQEEARAFISYAREDSEWAARLVQALNSRGVQTWFDRDSLLPGQDWADEIRKAIGRSRFFIAVLSHNSVSKRGVVQRELKQALDVVEDYPEGKVFFLPVRIDDCEPTHPEIRRRQWVDLFEDWDEGLRRLMRVLSGDSKSVQYIDEDTFRHSLGRFRHAVLGPVQGLSSAALMLAELASDAGADAEAIEDCRLKMRLEISSIRLWTQTQRVYIHGRTDLRKKCQLLKPVVQGLANEYKALLATRRIKVNFIWHCDSSLEFAFDESALELIILNLLDNARKYAFYNRSVTVGAEEQARSVRLWVENIGHPVPEPIQERFGQPIDAFSAAAFEAVVHGEGMGLSVVQLLVREHKGDLSCECVPAGSGGPGDHLPYRVNFRVTLPK